MLHFEVPRVCVILFAIIWLRAVMKFLFDFFPVVLFFVVFKFYGIYIATAVAIAASIVQVTAYWLKHRRCESMHIITLALIVVLGGATLMLHNELFIKWKPTGINWAFALVLLGSHFVGKRQPLIQRMMQKNITLPTIIWQRLNISWMLFFALMGATNLYVAYYFDTNTWVNFKLFGVLGLTLLFVVIQAIYLSRHIEQVKGT